MSHQQKELKRMKIEYLTVSELSPWERNPRLHSAEQVQQIANSILEFGFNNPILVDENNVIIAGHGRLEAAQLLNLDTVPVIILSHLTESQRKAYVIADNKLAMNASWDEILLKKEIELLQAEDFDTSLLGFTDEELQKLVSPTGGEAPPKDFKEVDDSIDTQYRCPSCGYEWSGKPH